MSTTHPTIWGQLQAALGHVHNARFEVERGNTEAALIWLEDIRGVLGSVALELSGQAELERRAWERLMQSLATPPRTVEDVRAERRRAES